MTIFFNQRRAKNNQESDYDTAFQKSVERGLQEAREGNLIPHEEIEKEWAEEKKHLMDRKRAGR